MSSLRVAVLVLLAAAAGAIAVRAVAPARAADPQTLVLHIGDRVVVDGAAIGCQVVRRGSRPVMDCRRGGRLAGTYGAMLSERRALVVRFRSDTTAKVVFTARHHGRARACGSVASGKPCR
jgi:hypothetical protein